MEHQHNHEETGINGQQYAFTEHCPNCNSLLAHLVKVYNAENVQKGRWCPKCKVEVEFDDVIAVDVPIEDEDAPKKSRFFRRPNVKGKKLIDG